MKLSRPLSICAWFTGALFLLVLLTILFIPARGIKAVLEQGLQNNGLTMHTEYFGKAFPVGIKARGLEIGNEKGALIRLDKVALRLSIPALLTGKIKFNYHAEIGEGSISGFFYSKRESGFAFKANDISLENIPFFRTVTGARIKGILDADASFMEKGQVPAGELRLQVKGAVLNGVKIGGTPLPDAAYDTIQGMYRLSKGRGTLESLSMQGKGIYMRLKGDIPYVSPLGSAPLNLTLELMPKPTFLENQKFVFLVLTKYLTTPGHYQIPIRGTLGNPQIL